jgi:(E)-4-hydroxy-3-methylbut-2-enyl-diphosphate synthase
MFGRNPQAIEKVFEDAEFFNIVSEKNLMQIANNRFPVVGSSEDPEADLVSAEHGRLVSVRDQQNIRYDSQKTQEGGPPDDGKTVIRKSYSIINKEDLLIRASAEFALLLSGRKGAVIWIENNGKPIPGLSLKVLQGLGLRFSKAEFVACPSCGRTKFNLFDSFNRVKERTAHLKGLQIAVMGCIVNGPGEMGDAHYGYVGAGPGKVTLYKDGEPVQKNIDEEKAVESLVELIKESGDWNEPT